jgi:hypothetical protein
MLEISSRAKLKFGQKSLQSAHQKSVLSEQFKQSLCAYFHRLFVIISFQKKHTSPPRCDIFGYGPENFKLL